MSGYCYLCFSKHHHTVSCSFPSTHSTFFLPKIDNDLISRFYQMLDLSEQIKLAISSPLALNSTDIQPFYVYPKVYSRLDVITNGIQKNAEFFPLDKNVVTNSLEFTRIVVPSNEMKIFFSRLSSRLTILAAALIDIEHCKFLAENFLLLLSQNTKILHCCDVQITDKLEFSEVIEKISHVFRVKLYDTNISFESNWLEKCLNFRNDSYLKQLKIDADKFMYDGQIDCGMLSVEFLS